MTKGDAWLGGPCQARFYAVRPGWGTRLLWWLGQAGFREAVPIFKGSQLESMSDMFIQQATSSSAAGHVSLAGADVATFPVSNLMAFYNTMSVKVNYILLFCNISLIVRKR